MSLTTLGCSLSLMAAESMRSGWYFALVPMAAGRTLNCSTWAIILPRSHHHVRLLHFGCWTTSSSQTRNVMFPPATTTPSSGDTPTTHFHIQCRCVRAFLYFSSPTDVKGRIVTKSSSGCRVNGVTSSFGSGPDVDIGRGRLFLWVLLGLVAQHVQIRKQICQKDGRRIRCGRIMPSAGSMQGVLTTPTAGNICVRPSWMVTSVLSTIR